MNTYSAYKDSGEQWLGQIPAHWEIGRLANYFSERREKVSDTIFAPLSVTKNGIFPQLDNVAKSNDGENRKGVRKGDFVINSRSDRKGSSGVSNLDGSVSLINIVLKPRKTIFPPYCNYFLKSQSFIDEFYRNGRGIVADLWTTRYSEMKLIKLAVPPFAEQEAMVAYLDEQTGKIDAAIEREQKMIDLLEERKQIIIQHAVTKGLNPNAKMKDSGIDWIGEIPEGWKVMRFKTIAKVQANLVHPNEYLSYPQIAPDNIEKGTGRLLNYSSVFESQVISDNHLFRKGQIIYSKIRPVLNKLIIAPFDGLCSADMYPISTTQNIEFLKYQMLSCHFVNQVAAVVGTRVKMPKINKEELGVLLMLVPPIDEQLAIASYLDNKLISINKAIAAKNRVITLLQERKQIIINEVVTGKIKVL